MAFVLLDVSTYSALLFAGPQGNATMRASIGLSVPNALTTLNFYPDDAAIPANYIVTQASGMKVYCANYPYYQYAGVIDLLRNEKPIKFYFSEDTLVSYITAANEPLGEEE